MRLEKTGLNLFFFVLMLSASTVTAQKTFTNYAFDSSTTYVMKLLDRTEYIGKFLQKDSTSVVIITNSGSKVEIPFDKIKSIEAVKSTNLKKGVYWFPNPNATRYFFGPSAFNLKKGEELATQGKNAAYILTQAFPDTSIQLIQHEAGE